MPTYHRLATATQTLDDMVKQLATAEFWGRANQQGGHFPAVKAYFGALPAGADGIEFDTAVAPSLHAPRAGITVTWYEQPNGNASSVPHAAGWCRIQATVRCVRYKQQANLRTGAEWP